MISLDTRLVALLACPYDRRSLVVDGPRLRCPEGHTFPIVHGVPVLLREDAAPTHHLWNTTDADIRRFAAAEQPAPAPSAVDPFVERWLVATCGRLYRRCSLPLARYPIPDLDPPEGNSRTFLDVGSNWGRWALGATRAGYEAVAVDPSLEAALAGARVARQLALPVHYVVGDVRDLPFRNDSFDVVFSYSVLQHLDKDVVRRALEQMALVMTRQGLVRVQIANVLGPKQLLNHARERIKRAWSRRAAYPFRVRPWTPRELVDTFSSCIGPATLSADGFFTLNAQPADRDLLPPFERLIVGASTQLCAISRRWPPLVKLADSLMVEARSYEVRESNPPHRFVGPGPSR